MSHVSCKSKLLFIVRSSKHPYPDNWMKSGCTVVYFARAFSAGTKFQHCIVFILSYSYAIVTIIDWELIKACVYHCVYYIYGS